MSIWNEADDLLDEPPTAPARSSSVWDEADALLGATPAAPAAAAPSNVWADADALLSSAPAKPRPPVGPIEQRPSPFQAGGVTDETSVRVNGVPTWGALRAQMTQQPRGTVGDATLDDALRRGAGDDELETIARNQARMQPPAFTLPKPSPDALLKSVRAKTMTGVDRAGMPIYGDPPPMGTVPVLDAPVVGVPRVVKGVRGMIPPMGGGTGRTTADVVHGANEALEGLMQTAEPAIAAGAVTNPAGTAYALVRAWLVQQVGEAAATAVGADSEVARLVGNVGATLSGGLSAEELARKATERAQSAGRVLTLASRLSGSGFGTGDVPAFRANPITDEISGSAVAGDAAPETDFIDQFRRPAPPIVSEIDQVLAERPEAVSQNVPRGTTHPAPDMVPPGEEALYNDERRVGNTGPPAGVAERRLAPSEAVRAAYKADPEGERAAAEEARRRADQFRAEQADAREGAEPVAVNPEVLDAIDQVLEEPAQPPPPAAAASTTSDSSAKPEAPADVWAEADQVLEDTPGAPLYFRSGSSRPADFDGFARAGVPVGVTATELSPAMQQKVADHLRAGGQVFVDSGAFGATPDFPRVLQLYADLAGANAKNLHVVAPDVVGDQAATVALQNQHRAAVQALVDQGVNVIVPIQKGPSGIGEQIALVHDLFGPRAVIGIRFNKSAYSLEELVDGLRRIPPASRPSAVHLLGIGERNAKYTEALAAIRQASPGTRISSDSNRLSAMFVTGRPAHTDARARTDDRAEAAMDDHAEQDTTELAGALSRGDLGMFTPAEIERLAAAVGITAKELRQRQRDDALEPILVIHEQALDMAIHQIALARGRRREAPGARTETIAEHEGRRPAGGERIVDILKRPPEPGRPLSNVVAANQRVQQFEAELKAAEPALEALGMAVNLDGTLYVETLRVTPSAQRQGVGTRVMQRVVDFADQQGVTVTLTPARAGAAGGTTSAGQLRDFYKRFGFVENKGAHRDADIDAKMYRRPAGARIRETDEAAEAPAGNRETHGDAERLPAEGGGAVSSEGGEPGAQAAPAETAQARAKRERAERRARRKQERDEYRAAVAEDERTLINDAIDRAVAEGYTGDREALHAVILDRVKIIRELDADYRESDRNPRRLLQEIARLGGIGIKAEAGTTRGLKAGEGMQGEIRWLQSFARMNATNTSGALGGVSGVFSEGPRALSLDGVFEGLKQGGEFAYITSINDLLEELRGAAKLDEPAADDQAVARAIGMLESSGYWWAESPVSESTHPADAPDAERETDDLADVEFDLRDFEVEGLDVLETGEVQPHLPGAGAVRAEEKATPEVADAPFSLESEAAETAGVEGDLFAGTHERPTFGGSKRGMATPEGPRRWDRPQTALVSDLLKLLKPEGQSLEQYVKEDRPASLEPLVADIRKHGITTPITVTVDPKTGEPLTVVDGRHRLRAAQILGISRVPVRAGTAPTFKEISDSLRRPAPPVSAKKKDGGTQLNADIVPGAGKFVERDLLPGLVKAGEELVAVENGVRAVWAPDRISQASRAEAAVIRSNLALRRQRTVKAQRAMRALERAWDAAPRSLQLEFAMAVDEGRYDDLEQLALTVTTGPLLRRQQQAQSLRTMAAMFKRLNDYKRAEANALGGRVGRIVHYYPREWVRPGKVRAMVERMLHSRKPLQGRAGFKKARTRDKVTGEPFTFKQLYDAGFRPVEYNPVRAHLRKWLEMDKWIAARRILLEGKAAKTTKFVRIGETPPPGWHRYDESFGTVYAPPIITIQESYDERLMSELVAFAQNLGIKMARKPNIGKGPSVWGYAMSTSAGRYGTGPRERVPGVSPGSVVTKFAGAEEVLTHEIGHILDDTYGLWERIVEPPGRETRTLTRGKRKGQTVTRTRKQDKATVARRKRVLEQLRKLADMRYEGADETKVPQGYKDYVREKAEQMANVVHAYIHIPERMKEVAPDAYWAVFNTVKDHPELSGLNEIQKARGVRLGSAEADVRVNGLVIAGYYYGPPEAVRLLDNHLSPGLGGNKALNLYRFMGNLLNQVQLGLSGFHLVGTAMNSAISKGALALEHASRGQFADAARRAIEVPVSPLLDIIRGNRALKHYYEHDANFRDVLDTSSLVVRAGGGVGWDTFWHSSAPERFMQAIHATAAEAKEGNYPGAALRAALVAWRAFPALVELQAKPVMEWWVPRLKLAAFLDLARLELRDLGEIPDELELRKVLGDAWDSVDNRFGELVYDNLFWHRILKDAGMASVRALGWNVGTVREVFGAPLAQVRSFLKPEPRVRQTGERLEPLTGERIPEYTVGREPWLTHKGAYFLALVFLSAVFGALYQKFHTGLNPGELEDGDYDTSTALLDLWFPRTGGTTADGRPERASLPTYIKDVYAFGKHPWPTMIHKLHPILSLMGQIWQNEDYYGNAIRDPEDPALRQALDLAKYMEGQYRPISLTSYFERQKNSRKGTAVKAVESFLGINVAPASVTRTPLEEYLHDIAPTFSRTKDQAARSATSRDVRNKLADKDIPSARQAAVEGNMTRRQALAAENASQLSYVQRAFSHLSLKQGIHAYEVASPHEREGLAKLLERKADNADVPADEVEELRAKVTAALKLPRSTKKPRIEDLTK
jgi:GNAT superfamily N-acetyltransferase